MKLWTGGIGEYLIRRTYFTFPAVVRWRHRLRLRRRTVVAAGASWNSEAILSALGTAIPNDADILVHCSIAGLGPSTLPDEVLRVLLAFCGDRRTLLIPTNPLLRRGADGLLEYDPARTPSSLGLFSEYARRRPGFLRSRHPISSVAAFGPQASAYLQDNLNAYEPLPHGAFSPYARIARWNGYTVCLGVPFNNALTMIHVSEETLDGDFPRPLRFEPVRVRVGGPVERTVWTVRCRSQRHTANISMWTLWRDLLATGAIQRLAPAGVVMDVVDNAAVVEFMMTRARHDGYPYMFLR